MLSKSNNSKTAAQMVNKTAKRAASEGLVEVCERRLVLSAQLLMEVAADQAIQMHGQLGEWDDGLAQTCMPVAQANEVDLAGELDTFAELHRPAARAPSTLGMAINPQMAEAHQATGWQTAQDEFGLTGRGQTVAVIDTGIAWDHQALGEGFGPGYRVVGGWDFTEENDAVPYDDGPFGYHGTHVAGIIGSDDAIHTGVAPEVDLVSLRVFNDTGDGQLSWVEDALSWVHDNQDSFENPITTVNLSLGTAWNSDVVPSWGTLEDELQALYEDGIVVTASAGNSFASYGEAGLAYPAASPFVLPVASVDDDGSLSDFSQRHERALAAPGSNISSTVPDHLLGSDGNANDFSSASGTSMAAPYMAGASVLVRQAMEMIGHSDIDLDSIASHLRQTGSSVFDAATNQSYDVLDLHNALDSLLPDDSVGDTLGTGQQIDLGAGQHSGWINSLGDADVFTFTASSTGTLQIDGDSQWLSGLSWTLHSGGSQLGGDSADSISVVAGTQYEIVVSANQEIGPYDLSFNLQANSGGSGEPPAGGSGPPGAGSPGMPTTGLGTVDYLESEATSGRFQLTASRDGLLSVQLDASGVSGHLVATTASGVVDTASSSGTLRIDVSVSAGETVLLEVPQLSPGAELVIANVMNVGGDSATLTGTHNSDRLDLDLSSGNQIQFGEIEYDLDALGVTKLNVDLAGGGDAISITGSTASEKVDLRPAETTLSNSQLSATIHSGETVQFTGGGGPDRVYLYDSDGNDTLTASPREAELTGAGYRYTVSDVDRIFIHATGSGEDYAYLHDSPGDDRLSMRPQFSSIQGDDFFNYVRGFERVFAYATAGGDDSASLYDSAGDDRFSTSGATASIVGPGFSSFSRNFEHVQAIAEAGGNDLATLYGEGQQVSWQQGADFVQMQEGDLEREARGFGAVETYVGGSLHTVGANAIAQPASVASFVNESAESTTSVASDAAPPSHAPGPASPGRSSFPAAFSTGQESVDQVAAGDASVWGDLDTDQVIDRVQQTLDRAEGWLQAELTADEQTEWLDLPDDRLFGDGDFERSHLDEVFRQFEENS